MSKFFDTAIVAVFLVFCTAASASSNTIGKIELPYVQQLEKELEYEILMQRATARNFNIQQKHKYSYGQSVSDRWFLEAGFIGTKRPEEAITIDSFELEAKLQLTEQGEFNNDWALQFEIERESDPDVWEFGVNVIVLHEWKKLTGLANMKFIYEMGSGVQDEFETEFSSQLKYRLGRRFEPTIEYYKNQILNVIGPGISGQMRLGGRKKLLWGSAALFSLDRDEPNTIFRFNIEYEF